MSNKNTKSAVPKSMQVQLARLFGADSKEARRMQRSAKDWKATLRNVLHELDRYIQANVDTDELHATMIASGLFAADESLKEDDFWPGYAEGLTRVVLVLLGDYPDHRRRKGGESRRSLFSWTTSKCSLRPEHRAALPDLARSRGVRITWPEDVAARGTCRVPYAFRFEVDARSICSMVQEAVSGRIHGCVLVAVLANSSGQGRRVAQQLVDAMAPRDGLEPPTR